MKQCPNCTNLLPLESFYKGERLCKGCKSFLAILYYSKNKDKLLSKNKNYIQNNKVTVADSRKVYYKQYRLQNKGKINHRNVMRNKKLICPKEQKKIIDILYQTSSRIAGCTGIKWSVDHIIPLSKGGQHCIDNLQLMPLSINVKKGDSLP